MSDTTPNKMRESFESWAKSFYQEQQMTILPDNHWTRPSEYLMHTYQAAWETWQASTANMQAKITELETQLAEANKCAEDALNERDKLGYVVVPFITAVDELLANYEECTFNDMMSGCAPLEYFSSLHSAGEEMNLLCQAIADEGEK